MQTSVKNLETKTSIKPSQTETKQYLETSFSKKPKKKNQPKQQSITKVNRGSGHGVGCWGNRRVVAGVRVDEGLYSAFKPVAKRIFGSTCRAVEAFMATIVACSGEAVNFGQTVEVKEIRIERNLRARRGLVSPEVSECITKGFAVNRCFKCGRKDVHLSKTKFDSGVVAPACSECLEYYRKKRLVRRVFGEVVHG